MIALIGQVNGDGRSWPSGRRTRTSTSSSCAPTRLRPSTATSARRLADRHMDRAGHGRPDHLGRRAEPAPAGRPTPTASCSSCRRPADNDAPARWMALADRVEPRATPTFALLATPPAGSSRRRAPLSGPTGRAGDALRLADLPADRTTSEAGSACSRDPSPTAAADLALAVAHRPILRFDTHEPDHARSTSTRCSAPARSRCARAARSCVSVRPGGREDGLRAASTTWRSTPCAGHAESGAASTSMSRTRPGCRGRRRPRSISTTGGTCPTTRPTRAAARSAARASASAASPASTTSPTGRASPSCLGRATPPVSPSRSTTPSTTATSATLARAPASLGAHRRTGSSRPGDLDAGHWSSRPRHARSYPVACGKHRARQCGPDAASTRRCRTTPTTARRLVGEHGRGRHRGRGRLCEHLRRPAPHPPRGPRPRAGTTGRRTGDSQLRAGIFCASAHPPRSPGPGTLRQPWCTQRGVRRPADTSGAQPCPTALVAAGRAGAAPLLALGDSYSSGEGAGEYEPGTDTRSNSCHRSRSAWPALFAEQRRLKALPSLACSGATVTDVVSGRAKGEAERRESQIGRIAGNPDVLTITIGGNDLGFRSVSGALHRPELQPRRRGRSAGREDRRAGTAPPRRVPRDPDAAPRGRLVIVDYPRLFPESDPHDRRPIAPPRGSSPRGRQLPQLRKVERADVAILDAAREAGVDAIDVSTRSRAASCAVRASSTSTARARS